MEIVRSLILFAVAGLAEIGGGWLVWQWLRSSWGFWAGIVGGIVLFLYGIIPTLQQEPAFGRVYAAYGGIFIVLSIGWAWLVDGWIPDRYDLTGGTIALAGVFVIMWGRDWF